MPGVLIEPFYWLSTRIHRRQIQRQFLNHLGYPGDFENPRSYQEKVQFRKIYGNHRFYASVADKYRVRKYVANRIGESHLIPLLAAHDRLRPEHFDPLPERFIIKANHGCKWHQIVSCKDTLDVGATVERFNRYARTRYGRWSGERHYRYIRPKILIEELLEDDMGGCPWDYCFFSYNSPAGFDYSYAIAAPDGRATTFTREGDVLVSGIPPEELAPHLAPHNFGEMVQVARALSADFDFVRVDLYSVRGKVYFGELTCTPHQGYAVISEPRLQTLRDEMWKLDAHNPRLYKAPRSHVPGRHHSWRSV